ncbi:MAG: hypothetical protein HPY83_18795 [Anaerolineae bacterium]|nr:hypothetical protein [Anaerolineae bacterium]
MVSLDFTMPEGMGGPHDFRVRLKTNDPLEPERVLQVISDWVAKEELETS